MRMASLASMNHENGKLQDSLFDVLKDRNGNLIESKNALKLSRTRRMLLVLQVINTIPVTLAECFPAN
jgi:hypothetical protein